MFINDAMAASTPALGSSSMAGTLIQLALILLIFYFLLIRPQQKRMRQHMEMVNNLKTGDRVLTNGGIYGHVIKLNGAIISIEIASGVVIDVDRMSIGGVVADKKEEHKISLKKKQNKGK